MNSLEVSRIRNQKLLAVSCENRPKNLPSDPKGSNILTHTYLDDAGNFLKFYLSVLSSLPVKYRIHLPCVCPNNFSFSLLTLYPPKEEENHEARSAQQKLLKHSLSRRETEVIFKAILEIRSFTTWCVLFPFSTFYSKVCGDIKADNKH